MVFACALKSRVGSDSVTIEGTRASQNHLTIDEAEASIADIATFPWVARHEWQRIDLADYPHVRRWHDAIAARPAVRRGMNVPPAP